MFIIFSLIGLCALGSFGAKANLRFRINSMEIVDVHPEYFDPSNTKAALQDKEHGPWEMENSILSKITIIKQLPNNTDAHLIVTAMSEGEYKKPTGINVWLKVCELLREKFFMGPLLLAMGFSENECPPGPGTYFQEGYALPNNSVPSIIPKNSYLSQFEIVAEGTPILVTNTILEIYNQPE